MSALTDLALLIASGVVGVKEQPLGSNRGPEVDEYVRSVGLDPAGHYPWCAAFVFWVCQKAAMQLADPNPCPRTGSALGLWHLARSEWKSKKPVVGSVFVMDFGHGTGHVGFVERVDSGQGAVQALIHTIEGNTNDTGSREGVGVFRRTRGVATINTGFIDFNKTP